MKNAEQVSANLEEWIKDASVSRIHMMEVLSEKIHRHKEKIMLSVQYHVNNAKSENVNTTNKILIKITRKYRNIENLASLIHLKCSDIVIPLHNRPPISSERE